MGGSDEQPTVAVGSVFGEVLWRLVRFTPGARGAVLVDDMGDPIDYAHWPGRISALDVQIQGAQFSLVQERMTQTAGTHGLHRPVAFLCGTHGSLLTANVGPDCYATLSMADDSRLDFKLRQFSLATLDLEALLT